MKSRVALFASVIGLCVAAPVLADPPLGSRLGERLKGDQEKREREAALGAHEMARCLVNKQRSAVRSFLASVDPQVSKRLSNRMSGEHECFNMSDGNDLVEGRMVNFPGDIYRGMLSEWMIRTDERTFSTLPALPRQLTYSRTWYGVSDRDVSVDEMATCVSESDPQQTLALLRTLPYSNDEGAAFAALGPTLGACLRAGVRITGNRQSLRAALADALYQRLANPAPVPVAAQAAKAPMKMGEFMKSRAVLLASVIGLCMTAPAQAADLTTDARAFGAREAVSAPDLSPDGSSVVYLTPGPGRKTVAVIGNLDTGQFHSMVTSDGQPESLSWCHFASPTRSVCRFGGYVPWQGSANNGAPVYFSRLVALDLDGTHPSLMGQPETAQDEWIRSVDGRIVDWLDSNGQVLVNRLYMPESNTIGKLVYNKKKGWGLDKLDVTSLRSEVVESPREATSYMTDDLGHVRLMTITDTRNSGVVTGRLRHFYRTESSRDWKPLFEVSNLDNPEAQPLAVDASINALYALRKKNGRYALYTIRLDGSMAETLIAENSRVDIDDVVRFGDGQKVIGYTYTDEDQETVYFDPEFKALAASLSKALPNSPIIDFADSSRDGRRLLIFAGSDRDPGRYYVFDRGKKTLTPAMVARPELEGRLASVKSVTIATPDGVSMPAYLTLPPGKPEKGLPAVVLPHGGPESRDRGGFNWLAQFLAARGYAVLQPQFRGSAGFGDSWLNDNGFKNWRTSIGDIDVSAKWMVAKGIADPNRIAILGWSYGGYAALQTAATDPGMYKAVVAIAPVTDLSLLKTQAQGYTNYDLVVKEIGSGAHVTQGSPANNAASIAAPVLLVHGTMDANVFFSQSQKMDAALKSAGKQSELVIFKDLDHQLDDSDARTQMLTKIGELLDRTIGR